jgi:DNA-binding HxlR family transcriptional regulator
VPLKIEYSISKEGESLKPIIDALWSWGRDFLDDLPDDQPIERISDNAISSAWILPDLLPK